MTQDNIFQEVQEDLERQKMEALWSRYGILVIAAAVALVLGTAATTYWQSSTLGQRQQATGELAAIIDQYNKDKADPAKEIEALQSFADKNSGKTQATLAHLHAAALVAKDDKQKAVQMYDAIAADGKNDFAFRQLADLLAVQVQMDDGDVPALQKRLQPLLEAQAPWRFSAMEINAYLTLRAGDKAKAKEIFTTLSQDASAPPTIGERAKQVLRLLAE